MLLISKIFLFLRTVSTLGFCFTSFHIYTSTNRYSAEAAPPAAGAFFKMSTWLKGLKA